MSDIEWVILVRLTSAQGFYNMGDALEVSGKLQQRGINAMAEQSLSALKDSFDSYLIKVPVHQYEAAMTVLQDVLEERS